MRIVLKLAIVLSCALMMGSPIRAGFILQAEDFTASPGSTGSFLVTLTNTGPVDATLSGYQIQLTTAVSGLAFTGVERAPVDYVFPGAVDPISSDFTGPPVTTFTAVDLSANHAGFDVLLAGKAYGVLRVLYQVDPSAPEAKGLVQFVSPGSGDTDLTQLSDASSNLLDFHAVDGRVQITAVPEPPSFALLGCALIFGLGARYVLEKSKRAAAGRGQCNNPAH